MSGKPYSVNLDDILKDEEIVEEPDKDTEDTQPNEEPEDGQPNEEVDEEEPTEDDDEEVFIEIEGEKIPLKTVMEWKAGSMKDADYRQKTAAVAEERRRLEQEKAEWFERMAQRIEPPAPASPEPGETEALLAELREAGYDERDPVFKFVQQQQEKIADLEARFGTIATSSDEQERAEINRAYEEQEAWIATQPVKADIQEVRKFALAEGIYDLKKAYTVMYHEELLAAAEKKAAQLAQGKIAARKKQFVEPGKPSGGTAPTAPVKPKTFDEAARLSKIDLGLA